MDSAISMSSKIEFYPLAHYIMDKLKPLFIHLSATGSSNFRVNGIISPVTYPFINLPGRFKPLEFTYEITGVAPLMDFLLEWTPMNHATIRNIIWMGAPLVFVSIENEFINISQGPRNTDLISYCIDICNRLQYEFTED